MRYGDSRGGLFTRLAAAENDESDVEACDELAIAGAPQPGGHVQVC